jgi:type I restriction-modification system DNA methylase subunit
MNKEQAKTIIENLVERFAEHRRDYHLPEYNEQKARQDFINPFFKALGWDVDNEKGASEAYREVIYEDKVVVRGKLKAPDYGFRLSGSAKKRLFYVEAKKPSIALKTNKEAAYQLRRYGSSAQAHVSILTNFEDFIVYDCSRVPNLNDSASVARLKHIHFEDYIKEFDFIYDTFSHEAVTKGRFDKFVQSDANKKGSQTLDKEFVQSLDNWRRHLAVSIALNNRKLNDEEINFAVQQTIDRLIFLRFCEDRAVEPYGQLQKAVSKGDAYKNLFDLFQQADDKYNSGLFDFEKDQITAKLKVDNKVIKSVIEELYYPLCRYEFAVMPVEVLGNAYEQFLGKVIRITPSRGVKIEEKPEVRKAGGVFYTPQYIVEYIVKNTVGKLIEGKTPKEITQLKIVDPACGSGSFLVGAFEYLLDYHVNWYHQKGYATKKGKDNPFTPQGTLTTHEKKRILTNNIFGVDLDSNAVEVAKLSLLLKCMEGETEASIKQQISLFHERVLPNLDENIKSGNSLIDTDFYDNEIDLGDEHKIKPFSWKKAFPQVFDRNVEEDKRLPFKVQYNKVKKLDNDAKDLINTLNVSEPQSTYGRNNGGFDIVIGNPPYVKVTDNTMFNYFQEKYNHQDYQQDLYLLFLERYQYLLVKGGMLGVIIPNTWLQSIKFKNIRKYLVNNYFWDRILHNDEYVFKAVVDTHVLLFQRNNHVKNYETIIDISHKNGISEMQVLNQYLLPDNGDVINILAKETDKNIFVKIKNKSVDLNQLSVVFNGVKPFEKGKGFPAQTAKILEEKPFVSENTRRPKGKFWMPLLRGSLINRYVNYWENNSWIEYGKWLAAPRNPEIFEAPEKIIIRQTGDSIIATLIDKDIICRNNLHIVISDKLNHKLLLGIINSKLTNFYYYQINPEKGEALAEVKKNHVEQLPIPIFTKNNLEFQKEIIKHVESLLKLNEELKGEKLQTKVEQLKQRIEHSEERINQLVYKLYDLEKEDIKIIEEATSKK